MKNKKPYTSWFSAKKGRWWVSYVDKETGKTISMYRARFMVECMWGKLSRKQIAHHINGIKTDDRIENLEIKLSSDHTREHNNERLKGSSCVRCATSYRIYKANPHPSKLCPKCRKSDRNAVTNKERIKSGYWKRRSKSKAYKEQAAKRKRDGYWEKRYWDKKLSMCGVGSSRGGR